MATAAERLAEQLLAVHVQFEQERRAEIIAAGGDPDEDRDRLAYVRDIADDYARHKDRPDALEDFLGHLAEELDTSEVRALRLAAEAVAAVTPRLILADANGGVRAADTAADLGVTESYVYRVLREQRQRDPAAHPDYQQADSQLADVPDEHREAADAYLAGLRSGLNEGPTTTPH